MNKSRPMFVAFVAILFYTITDIIVWQRIFEANQMIHFAGVHHIGRIVCVTGHAVAGLNLVQHLPKENSRITSPFAS